MQYSQPPEHNGGRDFLRCWYERFERCHWFAWYLSDGVRNANVEDVALGTELLRLEEKRFVQGVSYFINKISIFISKVQLDM
jgi:hypothetical protein